MAFIHARKRIPSILPATLAWMAIALAALAEEAGKTPLLKLREAVSGSDRSIMTFRIEGVVRAFSRRLGLIALDDGASIDLLELPSLPADLVSGNHVVIEGDNCLLGRGPLAIRLGTAPVIGLDGHHPVEKRSGKMFLRQGMRPLRAEWFNGYSSGLFELEYEGPETSRRKVSADSLWHLESGNGDFKPGLQYSAHAADFIHGLSDLAYLQPQAEGISAGFDLSVRPKQEMAGIVFTGFLEVPRTGLYTFHLASDDGGRLFLSNSPVTCNIIKGKPPFPGTAGQWGDFSGTVTYAGRSNNSVELDITGSSDAFRVTIADATGLESTALLHKRVKVSGLKRDSGIVVTDATHLRILPEPRDGAVVLTKVSQVRQLGPGDAARRINAEIQGVVTMVNPRSMVVQDETGGVFVHYFTPEQGNSPNPSELWKIEGYTDAGDFSPVLHVKRATCLGTAPLPKAVQPTQQQLASGSLDAELIEIEGVLTDVSGSELKLLTRSGMASVMDDSLYPLPTKRLSEKERESLAGSVVRLRGVCRAIWDMDTGNVQPARMMLGNATVAVDEPATGSPYSVPLTRPSDLLLFSSHPTALKRVRVSGQLLHSRPPELFLFDGTSGFRAVARGAVDLTPGDEVEVSGFPQLGGPSPALLEASVRNTGHAASPAPNRITAENLPDASLDSTLVEIEAVLLSDTVRMDERALEMRAGSNRFVALVPSGKSMPEGIERDSILRLTGVYVGATADRTLSNSDPFEMRLHDTGSIEVIKRGPWWTTRRTMAVVSMLSAGLALAFFWVTLLRRTVAKRSRELALEIEERESIEHHRAMEQERSRMARDLHDELGGGLTEAGFLGSLIGNPAISEERKAGYLAQLNGLCCTLVAGLDEIVWAVNPRYDSVADLAGYFSLYAQRFLKLAGIECRLRIDDAITKDPLDSRTRHEIFLAFKEALNNIVRHSGATEVHLTIEVATGSLMISLEDNGRGFDLSATPPGSDGLRNMEERIRSLGGTRTIETRPDEGTTLRFNITLKGQHT